MRKTTLVGLSLDKAFLGFMVLGALVFFGVTVFFISKRVADLQDELVRSVVEIRGDHIATDIVSHLSEHWDDLEALATVLPFSDRATFRSFLTREVADGEHMVWAAYVDLDGDVALASRLQREGENVAAEDWFLRAQAGSFVGYSETSDGEELLIMTLPVTASGSVAAGFLTFHFKASWFERRLGEIARTLALDVVVFDGRGVPVLHSFAVSANDMNHVSVQNALAGQRITNVESWSALGRRYAATIPDLPSSALPAIGWRIVVLTPTEQFTAATSRLAVALSEILGAVALALLIMSIGFIRIFLVPLHRLVMNASEVAEGGEVLPMEHHRTAELSILSSAIVRMQGRMLRAEDRVAELEEQRRSAPSDDRN